MITTTLKNICLKFSSDEWEKLDNELSKTTGNGRLFSFDEPFPLAKIVEINGLECAINAWELQQQYAPEQRLFAVFCARMVQHLMEDPRSSAALNVAERFANGDATDEDLAAARAAWQATCAVGQAVGDALEAMPEIKPILTAELIRICNETEGRE